MAIKDEQRAGHRLAGTGIKLRMTGAGVSCLSQVEPCPWGNASRGPITALVIAALAYGKPLTWNRVRLVPEPPWDDGGRSGPRNFGHLGVVRAGCRVHRERWSWLRMAGERHRGA